MSVDGANAQDMLFLARLMAIGTSDSSFNELANRLLATLVKDLRVDAGLILLIEGSTFRPIAWQGIEIDPAVRTEQDTSIKIGLAIQTMITIPLVYNDQPFGRVLLYITESSSLVSRFREDLDECLEYREAVLQAIGHSVSASLYTRRLQELHTSSQFHLHSVVQNVPFAMSIFDSDRKILLSNELARDLVGRSQWSEIDLTPNLYQICDHTGNPLPTDEWPFIKAIRQPTKSIRQEYVLDFGNFQRRILLSVIPVRLTPSDSPIFISFAEDITARTEQDRRKDDFLTVASHELRSPLTPLLGFMQMARHQAESKQPVDIDVLLRAERQAHRIRRLLEGLLDFSRIETGRLQLVCRPVNLVEQLSLILEPWYSVGDAKRSFQVTLSKTPLLVMVDPDRLEQVITNIIDNALKHGLPEGIISVNLSKQGDNAVLAVSNDSDAVDSLDLEHVFDRFYQRNKSRGTFRTSMGLGLYISRQIIEQHGGSIEMQSISETRTTVQITLPLAKNTSKH